MHKHARLLVTLTSTLLCCNTVIAADNPDVGLDKKITIDCTGIRLHTAVERIAADTGVTIKSGKVSSDWNVRDLPVLICARDLPLGTLLRGIADSQHLLLSRHKTEETYTYRIWRDLKRERELTAFEEARENAKLTRAAYDWDALSLIKDMPDSAFTEDRYEGSEYERAISNVLANLGPEVRDRAVSGEEITISLANAPESVKPYLTEVITACWKNSQSSSEPVKEPLDKCLNWAHIRIGYSRYVKTPDDLTIEITVGDSTAMHGFSSHESWLMKHIPDFPTRPNIPESKLELGDLGKAYVKLTLDKEGGPSILDTKVKVDLPKGEKKPTYPELLSGVSKATGYSIIAEGSAARDPLTYNFVYLIEGMFVREVTVREVLAVSAQNANMEWYLDESHKLIIGRDKDWTEKLKALVPEKLILDMMDKLNADGVDLDDMTPLAKLTKEQNLAWFYHCPEYPEVEALGAPILLLGNNKLWQLYFDLKPSDKARAKAGTPIPLANADPVMLCRLLREQAMWEFESSYCAEVRLGPKPTLLALVPGVDTFTDPDSLPNLWIRLKTDEFSVGTEKKHRCYFYIESRDSANIKIGGGLDWTLPIRAPKKVEGEKMHQ